MPLQNEATRLMGTDLTLDLPSSVTPEGVGELAIAATLYAPGEVDEQALRVLVCWPGGSYGRDYWDIHLPGRDGYSFAEHMTARGFVVIAADPLGVGDSGRPEDGTLCTYDALADAAHGAVKLVRARLADGTLVGICRPSPLRESSEWVIRWAAGSWCFSRRDGAATTPSAFSGTRTERRLVRFRAATTPARRATAVEQAKGFWGDQWEARYGVVDKAPHQNWLNGPTPPRTSSRPTTPTRSSGRRSPTSTRFTSAIPRRMPPASPPR